MKRSTKIIHWLPRILGILAILFISMFALDAFQPGPTIWQQLGAFLIHLIPSFILVLLLVLAWKKELIGGIIFTLIGLATSPFVFMHNYGMNHSVWMSIAVLAFITLPFVVVGILFITSHYAKKKAMPSVS